MTLDNHHRQLLQVTSVQLSDLSISNKNKELIPTTTVGELYPCMTNVNEVT